MKKYKYTLTIKISTCIAFVIAIMGVIYTIQGIEKRYQVSQTKAYYQQDELKKGSYLKREITKKDFLGSFYLELSGKRAYGLICGTNVRTLTETYLVKISDTPEYYASLIVPRGDTEYFHQLEKGTRETYQLMARVEDYKEPLPYKSIERALGISDKDKIHQFLTPKYAIKIVAVESEKQVLVKGIALLLMAGYLFRTSIKRIKR